MVKVVVTDDFDGPADPITVAALGTELTNEGFGGGGSGQALGGIGAQVGGVVSNSSSARTILSLTMAETYGQLWATVSNNEIVISAGIVATRVTLSVNLAFLNENAQREAPAVDIEYSDNGSTWNLLRAGKSHTGYIRAASGHDSSSLNLTETDINPPAGRRYRLVGFRAGSPSTITIDHGSVTAEAAFDVTMVPAPPVSGPQLLGTWSGSENLNATISTGFDMTSQVGLRMKVFIRDAPSGPIWPTSEMDVNELLARYNTNANSTHGYISIYSSAYIQMRVVTPATGAILFQQVNRNVNLYRIEFWSA